MTLLTGFTTVLFLTCSLFLGWVRGDRKLYRRAGDDHLAANYHDRGEWLPDVQLQDIRCDGPLPDFELLSTDTWDAHDATLQEVCASKLVGRKDGSPYVALTNAPTLGGFCAQTKTNGRVDQISRTTAFFGRFAALNHQKLASPNEIPGIIFGDYTPIGASRLYLYCRDRCYCNATAWTEDSSSPSPDTTTGVRIRTQKPRGYPAGSMTSMLNDGHYTDRIRLDRYATSHDIHYQLGFSGQEYFTRYFWDGRYRQVTLDVENQVKCSAGDLPNLPFPYPYDTSSPNSPNGRSNGFGTILKLCAVALSGGNPGANAGAYCHRGSDKNYVAFSDEMTPRLEWTFNENFRFSFLLRKFCVEQCWCASGSKKDKLSGDKWELNGAVVSQGVNGQVILRTERGSSQPADKEGSSPPPSSVILAPGAWGANVAKPCVVDDVNYCTVESWPTAILGSMPRFYPPEKEPDINSAQKPPAVDSTERFKPEAYMCGRTCAGPAAKYCSSYADQSSGCKCVVPPVDVVRMLGLDPVAPQALCINIETMKSVSRTWTTAQSWLGATSWLGGRSVKGTEDVALDVESWPCPCNSTYVSQECCEVNDL